MEQWLAAIAAFLSAVATAFAAWAAIAGPERAARVAERLKRQNDAVDEARRLKLHTFATLMSDRGANFSVESVRAFNLIDVVFRQSKPVREAWSIYLVSLDSQAKMPQHEQLRRLHILLQEMARDLGLENDFRVDDFQRLYYPTARLQSDEITRLHYEGLLKANTPQANTVPQSDTVTVNPSQVTR